MGPYNNKINKITEPCMNLWTRTYVWYDGELIPVILIINQISV